MTAGDRFTLELPPDPAFMATARLFASSLARHYEIDENIVEDLKLAISEACSRALAADGHKEPVSVNVAQLDSRLVFEISQGEIHAPAGAQDTPTPSQHELATGLSLELITALFEDAEIARDDRGGSVLRFSIP